jgi:RNA polymerase sigma-70 factor (ECF subfamily)
MESEDGIGKLLSTFLQVQHFLGSGCDFWPDKRNASANSREDDKLPYISTPENEVSFRSMEDTTLPAYMDGLYAYAIVLSRNPAMAADLVQETYLRALKAKESLRPDSNVKSWLFTILRNIWLNQLRHERAGPKIAELDSDVNLADVSISTSEDPHDLYVRNLQREQVRTAIQQLPIEFREIIILREYEELSYSEIASLLQCPVGTVMSRLARARSRLGALLSISQEPLPTVNQPTVDQ